MKLLFFKWHSYMNEGIERGFKELDIAYDTFFYQFTDWEKDDVFLEQFRECLQKGGYTDVLSVNFAPLISQVCEELGVRYTAWVYDSPLHIRDLSTLKRSCNRIFLFDRGQAEEYRKQGANVIHMPLAVDTGLFHAVIDNASEQERADYQTDVAMVGQLYQTEYANFINPLREYNRGYLEGIIKAQGKIYGGYLLPELVTDDLLARMNEDYAAHDYVMEKRALEFMLAREVTGRERFMALALLSGHCRVDLYSADTDKRLEKVRSRGYANYDSQMPLVFSQSRINLNITLKSIRTGIPLRVLDILGCGGFVLSNYQEELAEYFTVGKELAVYEDMESLFYQAKYYLEHEEERKQIALAGLERVKRDFTFRERLRTMYL